MARARSYRVMRRDGLYEVEAWRRADGVEIVELIVETVLDPSGTPTEVVLRRGSEREAIEIARRLRQEEYDSLNPLPDNAQVWSSVGDEIDQLEELRRRRKLARGDAEA